MTVNGLRATQNNWRLDGSNYNNRFFGSAPVLPNPDTLEEFTVQSANYSARTVGRRRAGGAVDRARAATSCAARRSSSCATRRFNANDPFNERGRPRQAALTS